MDSTAIEKGSEQNGEVRCWRSNAGAKKIFQPIPGSITDRALRLLKNGTKWCHELAAKIGITSNAIHACLKRPVDLGIVIKTTVKVGPRDWKTSFRLGDQVEDFLATTETYRSRALELLKKTPMTVLEVAAALSLTNGTIRVLLKKEEKTGLLTRIMVSTKDSKAQPLLGYRLTDHDYGDSVTLNYVDDEDRPIRRAVTKSRIVPTPEARFWANPFGSPPTDPQSAT